MILPGVLPSLVLILVLTSSDGVNHRGAECNDCNENGPWWPLFKPSQIIHSEFPEHAHHRSLEPAASSHVVALASQGAGGINSPVRSYNKHGKHRVEWDHFGDVSLVTTSAYNSIEDRSSNVHHSAEGLPYQVGAAYHSGSREQSQSGQIHHSNQVVALLPVAPIAHSAEVIPFGLNDVRGSSEGHYLHPAPVHHSEEGNHIFREPIHNFQSENHSQEKYANHHGDGKYTLDGVILHSEEHNLPHQGPVYNHAGSDSHQEDAHNSREAHHYYAGAVHDSAGVVDGNDLPVDAVHSSAERNSHPNLIYTSKEDGIGNVYRSKEHGSYHAVTDLRSGEIGSHRAETTINSKENGPSHEVHFSKEENSFSSAPVHNSREGNLHEGTVNNDGKDSSFQDGPVYRHGEIVDTQPETYYQAESESHSQDLSGKMQYSKQIISNQNGSGHLNEPHFDENSPVVHSEEAKLSHPEDTHHIEQTKPYHVPSQEELKRNKNRSSSAPHGPPLPIEKKGDAYEQDTSSGIKSEEDNFFDDFFGAKGDNSDEHLTEDFLFSGKHHHHSDNSIEEKHPRKSVGHKKPVATSYASISSVFESRPVSHHTRDLLHPDIMFNDINKYMRSRLRIPVDQRQNGTNKYLVHESQEEDLVPPPIGRSGQKLPLSKAGERSSSFIPLDHPVYRYVKVHGGLSQNFRHPSISRSSTLHWQDLHPGLRAKFPFKYLQPKVHVQKHETMIRHVIPTKDPFSDNFWKESQKIENLKPPPLGQNLYYYKKKPTTVEFKKIARRRHSPDFTYIVKKRTKKLKR